MLMTSDVRRGCDAGSESRHLNSSQGTIIQVPGNTGEAPLALTLQKITIEAQSHAGRTSSPLALIADR